MCIERADALAIISQRKIRNKHGCVLDLFYEISHMSLTSREDLSMIICACARNLPTLRRTVNSAVARIVRISRACIRLLDNGNAV